MRILLVSFVLFFGMLCNAQSVRDPYVSGGVKMNRILFIVDASSSMKAQWGKTPKMDAAKKMLRTLTDSLSKYRNVEMALRVYGHQSPHTDQDCEDSKLEVPFAPQNGSRIVERIFNIRPSGITPIAYSLMNGASDFPDSSDARNIIILITDGEEACGMDPCHIADSLLQNGVIIRPFVIGLGIERAAQLSYRLACIGAYYDAPTPSALEKLLVTILEQILQNTTLQVNLLDGNNQPTETDALLTINRLSKEKYSTNLYHTLKKSGGADSIELTPVHAYDALIHTIPPIESNQIELTPNEHNILDVDASQGMLSLLMNEKGLSHYGQRLECIVTDENGKMVNMQLLNTETKYLVGTYDLEFLTLPRVRMKNIEIKDNEIMRLQLPPAGSVTFTSNIEIVGSVFSFKHDRMVKLYDLNPASLKNVVALQPGKYRIVYRLKHLQDIDATLQQEFTIKGGRTLSIKL